MKIVVFFSVAIGTPNTPVLSDLRRIGTSRSFPWVGCPARGPRRRLAARSLLPPTACTSRDPLGTAEGDQRVRGLTDLGVALHRVPDQIARDEDVRAVVI